MLRLSKTARQIAEAEDGKVYSASFCEGSLVGNPPNVSYVGGKVTNTSTTNSAVLVCPALKDNVSSTAGINYANFRYYKADTTGFLVDLRSFSPYGTASYLSSKSDCGAAGYKTFTSLKAATGVSAKAVSCQATLCRVEMDHANLDAERTFLHQLVHVTALGDTEAFSSREERDDGTVSTVTFVARPGNRLPDPGAL